MLDNEDGKYCFYYIRKYRVILILYLFIFAVLLIK